MKTTLIALFAAFTLTSSSLYAQQTAKIPDGFLESMQGDWKGKLTYTDYQNDATQVTMDVWLKSSIENKKLIKQFYYQEPNSTTKQKSKSQDTTLIAKEGYALVESGYTLPFAIQESSSTETKHSSKTITDGVNTSQSASASREQQIVMETADNDNNKPSTIRVTISTSPNSMIIKKEVKYNGTNSFFVRHTFAYTK
ncbi:MAG: hypothetical protein EAZ92_15795 [Candidatus Kapaibacterium sp.]|nr:MAG: hypothetical protein EAZ92_15795 [Candidatus Kapabacteria bacterium]